MLRGTRHIALVLIKWALFCFILILVPLRLESSEVPAPLVIVESKSIPPTRLTQKIAFKNAGSNRHLASLRTNQFQVIDGPETNAFFGHTAASIGDFNGDGFDDVAVGGFRLGTGQNGAIIIYWGSRYGVSESTSWRIDCPTNLWGMGDPLFNGPHEDSKAGIGGTDFGHQVEGIGDVNGDGISDFIVGATHYYVDKPKQGAAFVYYGSKTNLPAMPAWKFIGDKTDAGFGFSVAAAGDVNHDGYADVLVGAPFYRTIAPGGARDLLGRAFLFLGSKEGLHEKPDWIADSEQPDAEFGYSVHGAGDVNGDGFDDVLVGAPFFFGNHAHVGKAYLYLGCPSGLESQPTWTVTGVQLGQTIAASVFTAGDVNHDGFSDVVIAANMTSHGQDNEGMVLVFLGSPTGLPSKPSWQFEPNQNLMYLGHSVATAGDLNGDGYDDLVAGSFFGGQKIPAEGIAMVFHGSKRGLSFRPDWTARGGVFQSGFGATVRSAGDIDGDGYGDLIIGQPAYRKGDQEFGRAWIYYGSPRGLAESTRWSPPGEEFGFLWHNISVPLPNAAWTTLFALALAGAIFYITRAFYLRRERVNARLQAARESAQKEERNRIAQDLHDQLGAQLTQIALASGPASKAADTTTEVDRRLHHVSSVAGDLVENLANIVWLTKSDNDTVEETVNYLLNDVTTLCQGAGLECELEVPEELPAIPITASVRHELLMAVREAVHNVVKHAKARKLCFAVSFKDAVLTVEVADNGIGFDPEQRRSRGNGLGNFKLRMSRHDGRVQIDSTVGTGTRITFQIPCG